MSAAPKYPRPMYDESRAVNGVMHCKAQVDYPKHIPSPGVSLEAFIAMLITEFGVRPLRRDWESESPARPT